MTESYAALLAEYVTRLKYEDLPAPVTKRARQIVLDGIGCGLFGSSLPSSVIATKVVKSFESAGKAAVWGTPYLASAEEAALVNGTSVHGFELDDIAQRWHTGAVTLVPALALAAHKGGVTPGKALIEAIVAGTEVGRRVANCMGLGPQRMGFHFPSLFGVFAAAVASGRILQLTSGQMADAMSHAGALAAGLMAVQHGGMMKRMLLGRTAQTGVYAALLASEGFTGVKEIFELDYGGFCTAFDAEKKFDMTRLTEGLGKIYFTPEVVFKVYSNRGPIHTALDAIRNLREKGFPLKPDEIKGIRIRVPRWIKEVVGWKYVPRDAVAGQENLAYSVAVMILDGEAFIDQYTDEKLHSPQVLDLIERIEIVHDPALDNLDTKRRFTSVTEVTLKNGKKLAERVEVARQCSDDDLVTKFKRLAGKVADNKRVENILKLVNSLDSMENVSTLADALTFKGKGGN